MEYWTGNWPYGGILILISLAAVMVIYTIHFMLKRQKKLLDWMKEATIVTKAVAAMSWMLHWMYRYELLITSTVMLILLVTVFYIRVATGDEGVKNADSIVNSGNDIHL